MTVKFTMLGVRFLDLDFIGAKRHVHRVKNGIASVHPIRGDEIRGSVCSNKPGGLVRGRFRCRGRSKVDCHGKAAGGLLEFSPSHPQNSDNAISAHAR